ncbi:DUF4412 domain-containing protein [candidate division WOR-3 bacterium]|nr:DUF4412 domain-containing protein [candidate division WOR-3 bacterium]
MGFKKGFKALGLCILLLGLAIPCVLQADTYVKQKTHVDAYEIMGQAQPEKDEIVVTWMSKNKGRIDHGEDQSTIIRLDKDMMYFLDHTKKVYNEMPIGELSDIMSGVIEEDEGLSEEEKAEAAKFMKGLTGAMMQCEAKVTAIGEKKKIRGWKCKKYILKMKMMGTESTQEIWATEDVKINYELFRTLGSAMISKQPGFQEMFKEMKKIKGISVLTTSTTSVMGADMKTTSELLEVKEKSAPAGIYEIPKGYKKGKVE